VHQHVPSTGPRRSGATARAGRSDRHAVLLLQRAIGNRATGSLLARAPSPPDLAKPGPKQPPGRQPELVELGHLSAVMSSNMIDAARHVGAPRSIPSVLAKVWDAYEVWGFVSSGGEKNQGNMVALVAKGVAEGADKRITKGVGGRVAVGLRVAGRIVWVAWVGYEAYRLGTWLREVTEGPGKKAEADREAWRRRMMEHVWYELIGTMGEEREAAFDRLMGDFTGYAQVPELTKQAAKEGVEGMWAISDWWRLYLAEWQEAVTALTLSGGPAEPGAEMTRSQARWQPKIENIVRRMAADVKKVLDFSNDPRNWNLTDKQRDLLVSKWGHLPLGGPPRVKFEDPPPVGYYGQFVERLNWEWEHRAGRPSAAERAKALKDKAIEDARREEEEHQAQIRKAAEEWVKQHPEWTAR
jgi:hypothetical protein